MLDARTLKRERITAALCRLRGEPLPKPKWLQLQDAEDERVVEFDPDDPAYDMTQAMDLMKYDALPPAWRQLVNEYGFNVVMAMKGWGDVRQVQRALEERRQQNQQRYAYPFRRSDDDYSDDIEFEIADAF